MTALGYAGFLLMTLGPRVAIDHRPTPERPPNVIVVFCDDLGYGDLGCFGSRDHVTPHLDRMAKEGVRFTDFYVAQAVCSASRAALLTGCYPNRIGILGALGPQANHGIHADETTLGEVAQRRGYATAIFGKWHLGHHPEFLPKRHGFDHYFGLPYSNDMWPFHPTAKFPPLPLIEGDRTIETNPDQSTLTTLYTQKALAFIEANRDRPFLLYLAHTMPHVPLFVSAKHRGSSKNGLYGDVVAELDWSIGEILATLNKLGIDRNTLVIFTSDNGPWLSYGNHGGSAGYLREGKGTCFEGGLRVPFIARWPGRIAAGRVASEPWMTIDLLPTICQLIGAPRPNRKIDGVDMTAVLLDANARGPIRPLYFYWDRELHAIRLGPWKLHLPHSYRTLQGPPGADGKPGNYRQERIGLALFDLHADPGEISDVAAHHPQVVAQLLQIAEEARADLGDTAAGRTGSGVRAPGRRAP